MVSGGDPLGLLKKVAGQGLYREPREMLPDLGDTLSALLFPPLPSSHPHPDMSSFQFRFLKCLLKENLTSSQLASGWVALERGAPWYRVQTNLRPSRVFQSSPWPGVPASRCGGQVGSAGACGKTQGLGSRGASLPSSPKVLRQTDRWPAPQGDRAEAA